MLNLAVTHSVLKFDSSSHGGSLPPVPTPGPGEFLVNATRIQLLDGNTVQVPINRINGNTGEVTLNIQYLPITALTPEDFDSSTTQVTFQELQNSLFLSIPTVGNSGGESDEFFLVSIDSPSAGTIIAAQQTAVVTLSPVVPSGAGQLSFGSASVSVPEENLADVYFLEVFRQNGLDGAVSVNFEVYPLGVTPGSQAPLQLGTLDFANTVSAVGLVIPVQNGLFLGTEESVNVFLSNPTGGASIGGNTSIRIDIIFDATPVNAFVDNSYEIEGDSGNPFIRFTVTLDAAPGNGAFSVDYATEDLTGVSNAAVAGVDYVATSGNLDFAANETSKTIDVPVIPNTVAQPSRKFAIQLSNPSNLILSDSTGFGVIESDEFAPLPNLLAQDEPQIDVIYSPIILSNTLTSSMVEVRRQSDGTVISALPERSLGHLNDHRLLSSSQRNDGLNRSPGFVAAMNNQAGSGQLTQSVVTQQGQIATDDSVSFTSGGLPFVGLQGNQFYLTNDQVAPDQEYSILILIEVTQILSGGLPGHIFAKGEDGVSGSFQIRGRPNRSVQVRYRRPTGGGGGTNEGFNFSTSSYTVGLIEVGISVSATRFDVSINGEIQGSDSDMRVGSDGQGRVGTNRIETGNSDFNFIGYARRIGPSTIQDVIAMFPKMRGIL